MRIDMGGAFVEALARWRRDREIVVAVAGLFYFLPTLTVALLMPPIDPPAAAAGDPEASRAALATMIGYLGDNAHWLLGQWLFATLGGGVLLALFLDHRRPTVLSAMGIALRRLPALLAADVVTAFATFAGLMLFLIPGFYIVGRTFVTAPVLIAEPRRGVFDAIARGVALTERNGFALFVVAAAIFIAGQLAGMVFGAVGAALSSGGSNPVVAAMVGMLLALAGSAASVAFVLVRVSIYRRLAGASKG